MYHGSDPNIEMGLAEDDWVEAYLADDRIIYDWCTGPCYSFPAEGCTICKTDCIGDNYEPCGMKNCVYFPDTRSFLW